jgi:hypothetical protein
MKEPWLVEGTIWKTEAAWINWLRGAMRSAWKTYPLKIIYKNSKKYSVVNTNPRSMKRFPTVSRIDCEICGNSFPFDRTSTEVDHVGDSGTLRCIEDVETEIKRLFWVDTELDMRILCTPCHKIVNHAQLHNVSFEEAAMLKEVIRIFKEESLENILDFIAAHDYNNEYAVNNAVNRKAAVRMILEQIE